MALQKAKLRNVSRDDEPAVDVMFNPTEYGIDEGAKYAELLVPGLQTPIMQFVRGEARTLTVELFLDGTDRRAEIRRLGARPGAKGMQCLRPVDAELCAIRTFVCIDPELHAPPVCRFEWGTLSFQGVVTSLKERFQLFDEDGALLRVRVTLTLKQYQSAEAQQRELRLNSPDRTRVRVLREGETLAQLAAEAYGDPRLWRVIAEANDIDRPRFVPVGTPLRLPAV
jgi:hypothetical protein